MIKKSYITLITAALYANISCADDMLFNHLNDAQAPAPVPAFGAKHEVSKPYFSVPCQQNKNLRRVERNQTLSLGQCDFEKRLKISGSFKVSTGVVNHAIGDDMNGTVGSSDQRHTVTFMADTLQVANINIDTMNDIWLDRLNLNFDAVLTDWMEAHLSVLFWDDLSVFKNTQPIWYGRYQGNFQQRSQAMPIDEASLVLGNFSTSPFYLRIGRQYLDFGWYDKTESVAPMTQFFSQGLRDAVMLGALDVYGFSGSITAFRSVARGQIDSDSVATGMDRPVDSINNFAASLSYGFDYDHFSFDVKADYMFDMLGIDYFDGYLGNGIIGTVPAGFDTKDGATTKKMRPNEHVGMGAVSILARFYDLDLNFQYVTAMDSMDKAIWSTGGVVGSNFSDGSVSGARPHAWGGELGFSIPVLGRDSRVALGWYRTEQAYAGQTSDNVGAAGTILNYYMPRKRVQIKAQHNLMKQIDISATYLYDNDYTEDYSASINNSAANGTEGDSFRNVAGTRNHNDMFVFSMNISFA